MGNGSVFNAYLALSGAIDADIRQGERLGKHTSYRIGGPAALFVTPHTYSALARAVEELDAQGVPWVVLGRGSNVLVSDEGFDGCVITLGREFSNVMVGEEGLVTAGAGALLSKLVTAALGHGLSGIEACVGIPGTVGGALAMDAGSRDEWIGSHVETLVTLRPGEGLQRYAGSDITWGYRYTSIPKNEVILEATLRLEPSTKEAVSTDMNARLARRRATQPVGMPSCGSVFANPAEGSVGKMLDDAGCKGFTVGGAQCSPVHANFIVNTGGATAEDVCAVMREMQGRVKEVYGVDLRPEVRFLGFADEA